jgi:hypothetical protein
MDVLGKHEVEFNEKDREFRNERSRAAENIRENGLRISPSRSTSCSIALKSLAVHLLSHFCRMRHVRIHLYAPSSLKTNGLVCSDSPQRIRNRQVSGSSPLVGSILTLLSSELKDLGIALEGRFGVPLVLLKALSSHFRFELLHCGDDVSA